MADQPALHAPAEGLIEAQAVIVGAGPAGLFQIFELGLLGIAAHVIDALPYVGGQCIELYPDKPIYDIPAVPVCTGRELIANLQKQIAPFKADFHLGQVVTVIEPQADGRFVVVTDKGTRLLTPTLFIAGGVGAFQPRLLKVDGLDQFLGTQLFYHRGQLPAQTGSALWVAGGTDSALESALALSENPTAQVTLLHRRDVFQARPDNIAAVRERIASGRLGFVAGQITGITADGALLTGLAVTDAEAATTVHPVDTLLVQLGLSPKLGPLAEWGLALERKQVVVDTENFQTSIPGIFAIGDVNIYPGKKKLILSAFHEATLAAFAAAARLWPEQRIALQYTTASTLLHQRLGVSPPADAPVQD
ncbi:MAG: hypothetical protein RLZZ618_2114 [Pseudomonadota bacterium]